MRRPRVRAHPLTRVREPGPARGHRLRHCTRVRCEQPSLPQPRIAQEGRAPNHRLGARSRGFGRASDITRHYAQASCLSGAVRGVLPRNPPRPRNRRYIKCPQRIPALAKVPRSRRGLASAPARAARVCAPSLACCGLRTAHVVARGLGCAASESFRPRARGRLTAARFKRTANASRQPAIRPATACVLRAAERPRSDQTPRAARGWTSRDAIKLRRAPPSFGVDSCPGALAAAKSRFKGIFYRSGGASRAKTAANPRHVKENPASGRNRTTGHSVYANDNPVRFTDPNGRNATAALGGVFYEAWSFVTGNGFHGSRVVGALKDGYNGQGAGLGGALKQDAMTFVPIPAGKVAQVAKLLGKAAAKILPKAADGAVSRILGNSTRQLQKKFKHAGDFGVTGNYSKANAAEFSRALNRHINSPEVRVIQGTYHKQPVTHFLDPQSGLNVIADPADNFISGWRLSPEQLQNVLTHGGL